LGGQGGGGAPSFFQLPNLLSPRKLHVLTEKKEECLEETNNLKKGKTGLITAIPCSEPLGK